MGSNRPIRGWNSIKLPSNTTPRTAPGSSPSGSSAAIRAVAQGKSFVDPAIADKVIKGYLEHPETSSDETLYDRLSDREKTVFKLIAEGYTSRQIAESLYLSIKTIMTHRANIMEKLELHNRADLIKYAIRHGLILTDS